MTTAVQELDEILSASAASDEFKTAVQQVSQGRTSPLISFNPGVPAVKAIRAVSKLLEAEPSLVVNSVKIEATSGCSDFVGNLTVNDGEARYDFVWDCAWRAEQESFTDHFGYPDQIRAARQFGYQCFKKFDRVV